jgi:hypothetical protein
VAGSSKAFKPVLALGFHLVPGPAGDRGESVVLIGDQFSISLSADWLEGELAVDLRAVGGVPVALTSLVDASQVRGLHLQRISRSSTAGQLESTLDKIADLLVSQAADVLAGTTDGLARLGM